MKMDGARQLPPPAPPRSPLPCRGGRLCLALARFLLQPPRGLGRWGVTEKSPGKAPISSRPAQGQNAAASGLNGASPPAADSSGLDHLPGKRKEEAGLTTGVVKKGKMAAAATQSSTHKNQQSFVCTCQPPSCPPRPCLAYTARSGLGVMGGGQGSRFSWESRWDAKIAKGPVVNRGQPAGRLPQEPTKCQDQPLLPAFSCSAPPESQLTTQGPSWAAAAVTLDRN